MIYTFSMQSWFSEHTVWLWSSSHDVSIFYATLVLKIMALFFSQNDRQNNLKLCVYLVLSHCFILVIRPGWVVSRSMTTTYYFLWKKDALCLLFSCCSFLLQFGCSCLGFGGSEDFGEDYRLSQCILLWPYPSSEWRHLTVHTFYALSYKLAHTIGDFSWKSFKWWILCSF
jgi:hypothetical protein